MNESQYVYFNDTNPILNFLTENYQQIRNEFSEWAPTLLGKDGLTKEDTRAKKLNYQIQSAYLPPGSWAYNGIFKSVPVFLRDSILDKHEAAANGWPNFKNGGPTYMLREERIKGMPTVGKWITDNLDILGSAQFNICTPGSQLNHHWGLDYKYLRCHLVLEAAEGCIFDIENERHEWVDGELFGFDDSMVLHGTKHFGNKPRTIFIFDILKTAVKDASKTWPIKPWAARKDRPKIVIKDWY